MTHKALSELIIPPMIDIVNKFLPVILETEGQCIGCFHLSTLSYLNGFIVIQPHYDKFPFKFEYNGLPFKPFTVNLRSIKCVARQVVEFDPIHQSIISINGTQCPAS